VCPFRSACANQTDRLWPRKQFHVGWQWFWCCYYTSTSISGQWLLLQLMMILQMINSWLFDWAYLMMFSGYLFDLVYFIKFLICCLFTKSLRHCRMLITSRPVMYSRSYTHTHMHLMTLSPGLPGWATTRKVKPVWILLKQETVNDSGISWAICKSALHFRQITTQHPTTQFLQAGCPSWCLTNIVKALKARYSRS